MPAKQSAAAATIGIYRAEGELRRLLIKGFIRREREGEGAHMAGEYVLCVGASNYQDTTTGSAFVVFSPPSRLYKTKAGLLCLGESTVHGADTKTSASSSSRSLQFPQNESDESDNDRKPYTWLFVVIAPSKKNHRRTFNQRPDPDNKLGTCLPPPPTSILDSLCTLSVAMAGKKHSFPTVCWAVGL